MTSSTNNLTHLRQPKHLAQRPSHRHLRRRRLIYPPVSQLLPIHTLAKQTVPQLQQTHNGASRLKSTRKRPPPAILRPPRPQPKRHTRRPTTTPRPQQFSRSRSPLLPRRRPRRRQHLPQNLRSRLQTHSLTLTNPLLSQQQLCTSTLSSARSSWCKCSQFASASQAECKG